MGHSQALNDAKCGKHSIHHGSTAVTLEFDDILAGRARRPVEPQNQCLIEQLVRIRMPKLSDAAVRAAGKEPAIRSPAACACGPLTRMIDTAAGGRPLDNA